MYPVLVHRDLNALQFVIEVFRIIEAISDGSYIYLPELNTGRRNHACGIYKNTNQRTINQGSMVNLLPL